MGHRDLFIATRLAEHPNEEKLRFRHEEIMRISREKRCNVFAAMELLRQRHNKTYGQVFQCVQRELATLEEVYRDVQARNEEAS